MNYELVLYIAENINHKQELLKKIKTTDNALVIEWDNPENIIKAIAQKSPQFVCYFPGEYLSEVEIIFSKINNSLSLLIPSLTFPQETAKEFKIEREGWIISGDIIKPILKYLNASTIWTALEIANALDKQQISYQWESLTNFSSITRTKNSIFLDSKVLALVPHYRCEKYLYNCLRSLVKQTRKLDKIVVIDDNSEQPPVDIVKHFPEVILLRSPVNVGPYRLIQKVIEETDYDAYLFQDADDWSTYDRLEKLLKMATQTGAELIGTQEWQLNEEQQKLSLICYPLDVNIALAQKPGHPLLHPSSLISRDLIMRLGGFATGLKFGGDTEFLLRAVFVARIVNIPDFCYFRRKRINSLTTYPETDFNSPLRKKLLFTLKQRFYANLEAIKADKSPDLNPLCKTQLIPLNFIITNYEL